ncbi:MAG: sulfide/dihydroorotate dehydrogenase-like FAD/NAD-binding protein [Lachnospiraceae bacterium]|nr:sulfide/dihydroorotate dehydrogenase-like FAD/NAD-binding protein [Lachnospiraceae bacterium]MEE3460381.1 sulfide/dihydroorotate dehydrogenase-like FAD/NAD-binding protein [Lachnospiraceae bacterium]
MYKILKKEYLANNIWQMVVEAPLVAKSCMPGQFIIVKLDEKGERIPLTISDYDREKGTITLIVQTIGASTEGICSLNEGESFEDFVGPLGRPSDLCDMSVEDIKKEKILYVAGGVGTAPVYCQVKWLKEIGAPVDVIIGARTKDIIIYEDDMRNVASELFICTDDGSYGFKGNTCDMINELIKNQGREYTRIIAIGPMVMMKFVSLLTKELGIKTIVSMNTIMVDGTGMCGACRLKVGDETKFACVDGPEFDGHLVDWDVAMKRQRMYKTPEAQAKLRYEKEHGLA